MFSAACKSLGTKPRWLKVYVKSFKPIINYCMPWHLSHALKCSLKHQTASSFQKTESFIPSFAMKFIARILQSGRRHLLLTEQTTRIHSSTSYYYTLLETPGAHWKDGAAIHVIDRTRWATSGRVVKCIDQGTKGHSSRAGHGTFKN